MRDGARGRDSMSMRLNFRVDRPPQIPREKRSTSKCNFHQAPLTDLLDRHKSALIRVFPNRQLRTRRPPRFHHFVVAFLSRREPAQQINDQIFYNLIRHKFILPQVRRSQVARIMRVTALTLSREPPLDMSPVQSTRTQTESRPQTIRQD
jgi:hypothetical protein